MEIKSSCFKNGDTLPLEQVLNAHGCTGGNTSPDLEWTASGDAESYALVCHDPDAPVSGGWYHWIVLNIPKNVTSIKKGEINYTETMTDFGQSGYGGACPPIGHGLHHYHFIVYALNVDYLDIKKDENPRIVHRLIKEHMIDSGMLTAVYRRD